MIMSGYYFMGDAPYHTVYLHGTVRDMQHRKMSKSLGNGIDPMDVVRLYGADALRWTMIAGMGLGVDVLLDPTDLDKSFAPGRNFGTKLWNIGRFLLTKVGSDPVMPLSSIAPDSLTIADRWILDRLDAAISESNIALGPVRPGPSGVWSEAELNAGMRLDAYADAARRFVWNELADWYLETVKPRLTAGGADADVARAVLVHCFDNALRLLQPIIPFITETLWAKLPPIVGGAERGSEFLSTSGWPAVRTTHLATGESFELVRNAVMAIRQIRNEYKTKPGVLVNVTLIPSATDSASAEQFTTAIGGLTRSTVIVSATAPAAQGAAQIVLSGGTEVSIPLAELMGAESAEDAAKEKLRLAAELEQTQKLLDGVKARLSNEAFTARAKAEIVEGARSQERELIQKVEALTKKVAAL
jgi:valyl-tRNA synthetase